MVQASEVYRQSDRPAVALISNHGYAGVEIPLGGAPDTGGQNLYVNSLAEALDRLGYRVTVFTRGGFPHFGNGRIREEEEFLTNYVRYVYVPGGGDTFIRKEDIAVALDEEVDWIDAFIRREAGQRGLPPWAVYEFVNTHYWDAAILGTRLVERWRNDTVANVITKLFEKAAKPERMKQLKEARHWSALGEAPTYHIGRFLLDSTDSASVPLAERVREAVKSYAWATGINETTAIKEVVESAEEALETAKNRTAPALHEIVVSDAVGAAILRLFPRQAQWLQSDLETVDRHVWTPHSLGSLKQENFRDQPPEVCRALKFCERRSHERTICDRTSAFAATSFEIAEHLRTHYRVPGERIFYFPPCVDPAVFRPYADDEISPTYDYLSRLSGVAVEKLKSAVIVFETSRMDQTKRKDILLDAFAEVAHEHDDVYLFIGGGPENELFQALTARRDANDHLKGRAFLTGFIPDEHIAPLFSLADMYVSPSEMEGFGMSVLQAAASGAAVVASHLTPFAVRYVPQDAIIVRAGDVAGFAGAMKQLIDHEADRGERAERLRAKAQELNWALQTDNLLEHLRQRGFSIARGRVGT
jgi:glycosyltransferase involved in cell wall biosynthesis